MLYPTAAGAGVQGASTGTMATVTTPTWGVSATSTIGGTPTAGTIISETFTFVLFAPGPQYFDVVNTGTKTLVATTYQVALSASGLSLGGVSLTLKSCVAAWSGNSCSGGSSTIGTFTTTTTSIDSTVAPLAVGSRLHIQATLGGLNLAGSVNVTIQNAVNSSTPRDIAAKTTVNR